MEKSPRQSTSLEKNPAFQAILKCLIDGPSYRECSKGHLSYALSYVETQTESRQLANAEIAKLLVDKLTEDGATSVRTVAGLIKTCNPTIEGFDDNDNLVLLGYSIKSAINLFNRRISERRLERQVHNISLERNLVLLKGFQTDLLALGSPSSQIDEPAVIKLLLEPA